MLGDGCVCPYLEIFYNFRLGVSPKAFDWYIARSTGRQKATETQERRDAQAMHGNSK